MTTLFIILFILALAGCLFLSFKVQKLSQEKIRFEERTKALEQTQGNQEKLFNTLQEQAKDSFKQLATESLKIQKEELVAKNADLYAPLKETMDRFSKEMGTLRTESAQHHGSLQTALNQTKELNEKLAKEAQDLTTALQSPKKQGTWGEIILEDVLLSAGLREGVEFEKQVSFQTEEGNHQQPDFIVHLPHNRDMIIDSKMSLNSYTRWAACNNEEEKRTYLKDHVRAVEEHIKELAAKDYPKLLKNEKLDFTLMFIPIEYAYFAALQENPALNDLARQHHIYIVTASNLLTVLQIAENLWRMEHSTQTSQHIFKLAQEMHERVGRFVERMEDVHNKINGLQRSYEDAQKTLTGSQSILTTAKKLEQLRVKSAKKLPTLETPEETPLFEMADNTEKK
ncbi:MAG: DNA recombination protein RmuC [Elusimicrobiaceae bacterium]|nr:DNA recombination protein RmuC [Elusimicrobiaceae bacterium]